MLISITKEKTFTPDFNGNLDLPEGERIIVKYRVPNIATKNRISPRPVLKFNYDTDGRLEGGETEVSSDAKTIISEMLVLIRNCEYEDEKGKHIVTSAKDLFEAPVEFEPLVKEIEKKFRNELEQRLDEKN
jgi:predicted DNA-binding antitoxin AbrB/MazE fold protein